MNLNEFRHGSFLPLDSNEPIWEPRLNWCQDKETLQVDLAKALARVDVLTAGQAASSQVDEAQLRPLQTECEALKDEVTNKDLPTVPTACLVTSAKK